MYLVKAYWPRPLLKVEVKNTSILDGEEVIQIYSRNPVKSLIAYKRVFIPAGETITVEMPVTLEFLKRWDSMEKKYVLRPGRYEFMVGNSSLDDRLSLWLDF